MLQIPYGAQHEVLLGLQRLLEDACFRFAQARHKNILKAQFWDCPEAIELNQFFKKLGTSSTQLGQGETMELSSASLTELVSSVSDIRHAAVHRLRLSTQDFEKAFNDSERLLILFGDKDTLAVVTNMHKKINDLLASLEHEDRSVTATFENQRKVVQKHRRKLELWERNIALIEDEKRRTLRSVAGLEVSRALSNFGPRYNVVQDSEDTKHDARQSLLYFMNAAILPVLLIVWKGLAVSAMALWLCLPKIGWGDISFLFVGIFKGLLAFFRNAD